MDIPTFSSGQFKWTKGRGHATIGDLGLSQLPIFGFKVRSERTGEVRTFSEDHAVMESNEFFDGEGIACISSCGVAQVQIWH